MKEVLSTSHPGIRVTRQHAGGKVEGWNRVGTDFTWGKAFLFSILKFLFPIIISLPSLAMLAQGKKNRIENHQCKDCFLCCGCNYFGCKFTMWIIVSGNDTPVCWKFEELHSQLNQPSESPRREMPEALVGIERKEPRGGNSEKGQGGWGSAEAWNFSL